MLRILVTGGSGKIGSRVVKVLTEAGHQVVDYDITPPRESNFRSYLPKEGEFKYIEGDVRSRRSVNEATERLDVVVHLAAYPSPRIILEHGYWDAWDLNVTGTFNILQASVENRVKKVVYASSICATGILTWAGPVPALEYLPVDEKHPFRTQDLYGTGKAIGEQLSYMYSVRFGITTMCMRFAPVWFEKSRRYNEWTKNPEAMLEKSNPEAHDSRDLCIAYVGVDDVAQSIKLAVESDIVGYEPYNVGGADTPTDWTSLRLAKIFYPGTPIHNPELFTSNPKEPLWSISKIQRELGYKPENNWKDYLSH